MSDKYAIYLRKSRAEELADSTEETLRKHRALLDELARKKSVVVSDVYEEVVSGESISARPEMKRLLSAVIEGKYRAVLCVDIDRLGRGNMQDQGTILEAFQDSGTLIITLDRTYDLSNDSDEELTEFKAFFARREWKAIRKRMHRGLMQTVQAGGYVANEPYGYRKTTVDKKPTLEIVPEEAEFIRHIYSRYLQGVGAETISQELNAMGSVPRRNAQWGRSTVRQILRNPTYKGYVAWNRVKRYKAGKHGYENNRTIYMPEDNWVLVKGLHKGIISEADWDKVQTIRKSRYIPSSNRSGYCANPFSGLIYCARCGRKMQRMGDNKGQPYLLCGTKGCSAGVKFEFVEEALHDSLASRLERLKLENGSARPDTSLEEKMIAGLDKELETLDARSIRTHEFLEDGTYDRATFRDRLSTIESERNEKLARRGELAAALTAKQSIDPAVAINELENLLRLWPELSAAELNTALKSVIERIDYKKDKKSAPRDFSLTIHPLHFIW